MATNRKLRPSQLCHHANEVPRGICPCPLDCPCHDSAGSKCWLNERTRTLCHPAPKPSAKEFRRWSVRQVRCGCWWLMFDGKDVNAYEVAKLLNGAGLVLPAGKAGK